MHGATMHEASVGGLLLSAEHSVLTSHVVAWIPTVGGIK